MAIKIVRNDITKMDVDAIVNPANCELKAGGGCCGAIYRAAGRELDKATAALGGCDVGDAKITDAFDLPSKFIVHTVGPIWIDGKHNEPELLASCYAKSLKIAFEAQCKSIAFPLISSGIFGYPKDRALQVAWQAISQFLLDHDMDVFITIFDSDALKVGKKLFADVQQFIDDNYVAEHTPKHRRVLECECMCGAPLPEARESLDDVLANVGATFSEMLVKRIYSDNMKPSECYTRANITKQHFSKIQSDKYYQPKKSTVAAFALALKLTLRETKDFMASAGFALSHSSRFDLIIEYAIAHKIYNVLEVNLLLHKYNEPLLG